MTISSMTAHFILYVRDQAKSTDFYRLVLEEEPSLDVPGMTEFKLGNGAILGLMPEAGIKRLLDDAITDPAKAAGVPRSELYLRVADPALYLKRALSAGSRELSKLSLRSWGDLAAYCEDPDGHVLAFAMSKDSSLQSEKPY